MVLGYQLDAPSLGAEAMTEAKLIEAMAKAYCCPLSKGRCPRQPNLACWRDESRARAVLEAIKASGLKGTTEPHFRHIEATAWWNADSWWPGE